MVCVDFFSGVGASVQLSIESILQGKDPIAFVLYLKTGAYIFAVQMYCLVN